MVFLKEQLLEVDQVLTMKIYLALVVQGCMIRKHIDQMKVTFLRPLNKCMLVCGILELMKKEIFIVLIILWQPWEFYVIQILMVKNQMVLV